MMDEFVRFSYHLSLFRLREILRCKPLFQVSGNIVPIKRDDLFVSILERDLIFAASLSPAQTIFEDIIGRECLKFRTPVVPCKLLTGFDGANRVKIENTFIVILDARIRLATVIDQDSRKFHHAVFLHANLDCV